jgi:hypothetical protein
MPFCCALAARKLLLLVHLLHRHGRMTLGVGVLNGPLQGRNIHVGLTVGKLVADLIADGVRQLGFVRLGQRRRRIGRTRLRTHLPAEQKTTQQGQVRACQPMCRAIFHRILLGCLRRRAIPPDATS